MRIAIASGKGGTGKTTLAVNIAALLSDQGRAFTFADLDVEEPNADIFLKPEITANGICSITVPAIEHDACFGEDCKQCVSLCRFKALIFMAGEVMPFTELCHGCGLCIKACPAAAIYEAEREIGTWSEGKAGNARFLMGRMRVGEAMSPPLINAVKDAASKGDDEDGLVLLDCPPGTSCPAIAAVEDVDYVVMAAESTPFGLHDLKLAVGLMGVLGRPFGVVLNREGMGDDRAERYCEEQGITILGRLPHSMDAATVCSSGGMLVRELPEFKTLISDIWDSIETAARAATQTQVKGAA